MDFALRSNPTLYINAEMFLANRRKVFLPNLAELGILDVFAEKTGVLLKDHCLSRLIDEVISLLSEARRPTMTFEPHTTQIFQIPDVTPFGVLKRRLGYKSPSEDEKEAVTLIMKAYCDFKQTIVDPNIWGAFRAIGFELALDSEGEPY
jgi:hypothetical protein